ncbi:MAG: amidoligase family protein [Planctomycetaceae bacterium]
MNASEIAFGIEFETTLPNSDTTPIGPYHNGVQVPWLPTGWRAERDSSIQPENSFRKGCEFVSPRLRGAAGMAEVCEAIDRINEHGAKVNSSCGLHITIE